MKEYIRLVRPWQWTKNLFVLIPLVFADKSGNLLAMFSGGLGGFMAFCIWSGAVYAFNDTLDCKRDAEHPRKCKRPIAAGRILSPNALIFSAILAIFPILIGIILPFLFPGLLFGRCKLSLFLLTGILYLLNSLVYSLWIRHWVIADVVSIAAGFVLRILGGCFAGGIEPSRWLLLCGFTLALFLGFGKRRMELVRTEKETTYRTSLESYRPGFLNVLLGISALVCSLSYLLYTVAPETIRIHGTGSLIYTVPFVFFGIIRYAWSAVTGVADGPDEILFHDPPFLINIILWAVTVVIILFFRI